MATLIAGGLMFFTLYPGRAPVPAPPPLQQQSTTPSGPTTAPPTIPVPPVKIPPAPDATALKRDADVAAKAKAKLDAEEAVKAKAKIDAEEAVRAKAKIEAEEAAKAKAKIDADRKSKEDADRSVADDARRAKEDADRRTKEEADRKAAAERQAEAERIARLQANEQERQRIAARPRQLSFADGTGDTTLVPMSVEIGAKTIIAGGTKGLFRLWNAETSQRRDFSARHADAIASIAFSADEARIATGSWDGEVRIWSTEGPEQPRIIAAAPADRGNVAALRFTAPNRLVIVHASGVSRTVDPATGQAISRGQVQPAPELKAAAIARDGSSFAGALANGDIQVWNAANGRPVRTLKGHTDWATGLVISADGRILASASTDGNIRLWDWATGAARRTFTGHGVATRSVAISRNGAQIASGDVAGTIIVWNAASGEEVRRIVEHRGQIRALSFSPDGTRLTSASDDGELRVWYFDGTR